MCLETRVVNNYLEINKINSISETKSAKRQLRVEKCQVTEIQYLRKYDWGSLTWNLSLALISSICFAANRLASKGSTMITTFFVLSSPRDACRQKKLAFGCSSWYITTSSHMKMHLILDKWHQQDIVFCTQHYCDARVHAHLDWFHGYVLPSTNTGTT